MIDRLGQVVMGAVDAPPAAVGPPAVLEAPRRGRTRQGHRQSLTALPAGGATGMPFAHPPRATPARARGVPADVEHGRLSSGRWCHRRWRGGQSRPPRPVTHPSRFPSRSDANDQH